MYRKDSPQSVIDSYRRRQQMAPYFMAGLAILLVIVGIIILVVWFSRSGQKIPSIAQAASPSPTLTSSATATPVPPTATVANTSTITASPTITETVTPSGPFEYTVQENDNCWDIAVTNKVSLEVLQALNNFGTGCPIKPGDKILIPLPGSELPTFTPIPTDVRGLKIEYFVQTGDTLALIASRYNSTVDAIIKENKIEDANKINVGDKLLIPVNIVTPTITLAPNNTITPGGPTLTPLVPTATITATTKP
ncbi:MAG: LysM peptidoglycan-binding domain-containing protein [Anaerolineaceae bacterium]|nr:LysM peptidoglycan-binding domain-containing protein [Anaerolineaceae bacterium]